MKVEVAILGSSSLIVRTVTVDMINIELELVVFQLYTIGSEIFFPASLITVPVIS